MPPHSNKTVTRSRALLVLVLLCSCGAAARADEAQILADIRAFFATDDVEACEQLAQRIESDPDFDRQRVSVWLHRAVPFEARKPGRDSLTVPLSNGERRTVVLRIPPGYDAAKPWPVIYALHGTGGDGDGIIRYLEQVLKDDIDEFVIAAPSGYGEVAIHDVWPPPMEHPTILAALKRAVHVDSDRVYVTGYSRGGHAAWTLAVLHADQFAAAMPLAGTFVLTEVDRLWDTFLPNISNLPVFCAWGAHDTAAGDGSVKSPEGGIAGLNRRLCKLAEDVKLPVHGHEYADRGHGGITPPDEFWSQLKAARRAHYPASVQQTCRHAYQSSAYWLEGHEWRGSQWTEKLPTIQLRSGEIPENPEDVRTAVVRTIRSTLGELRGEVAGRKIDVRRRKISEVSIWVSPELALSGEPIEIRVSGRTVFDDRPAPDMCVCLMQAKRTYDFDRLRWFGLRFASGHHPRVIDGRTEFP